MTQHRVGKASELQTPTLYHSYSTDCICNAIVIDICLCIKFIRGSKGEILRAEIISWQIPPPTALAVSNKVGVPQHMTLEDENLAKEPAFKKQKLMEEKPEGLYVYMCVPVCACVCVCSCSGFKTGKESFCIEHVTCLSLQSLTFVHVWCVCAHTCGYVCV